MLGRVFFADDLAHGKNIVFCATGISDSALRRGVRVRGNLAVTHSVVMRAQNRTLRYIETFHDFEFKSLRLRSSGRNRRLVEEVAGSDETELSQASLTTRE